jgi:hypothetical protein
MSLKNPVTPPGIDSGTVRLVDQRLNHYATLGPRIYIYIYIYIYVYIYTYIYTYVYIYIIRHLIKLRRLDKQAPRT